MLPVATGVPFVCIVLLLTGKFDLAMVQMASGRLVAAAAAAAYICRTLLGL